MYNINPVRDILNGVVTSVSTQEISIFDHPSNSGPDHSLDHSPEP